MATNWNQPPTGIITDLLTAKNSKFTPAMYGSFAMKNVAVNAQSNAASKNTQMAVYPTDTTKYSGEVMVTYKRLDFTMFVNKKLGSATPTASWGQATGQTLVTSSTTQAQLVTVVNTLLGLQLSTSDYATLTATITGGVAKINITFTDTNLLWIPSISAVINLDQTTPTSTIITAPDLDGLDLPA